MISKIFPKISNRMQRYGFLSTWRLFYLKNWPLAPAFSPIVSYLTLTKVILKPSKYISYPPTCTYPPPCPVHNAPRQRVRHISKRAILASVNTPRSPTFATHNTCCHTNPPPYTALSTVHQIKTPLYRLRLLSKHHILAIYTYYNI